MSFFTDIAALKTPGPAPAKRHFDFGGAISGAVNDVTGAFNAIGTPGQSNYKATGYTPDATAFENPQLAQQQAALQASLQQQQQQQGTAYQNQAGLVSALQGQMTGQQPSVAQQQLAQSTAANNQAALSAAASGASVDPSLALRNATQAQGANNQNMAGQAATLRAGEQVAGEQTLAGVLGNQAQLSTQANLALQGMQGQESQAQVQNQIAQQQLKEQAAMGAQGINASTSQANAANNANLVGGILSGGASGAAAALLAEGGKVPDGFPRAIAAHMAQGGAAIVPPPPIVANIPALASLAPMQAPIIGGQTNPQVNAAFAKGVADYMKSPGRLAGQGANAAGVGAGSGYDYASGAPGLNMTGPGIAFEKGGGSVPGEGGPKEDNIPIMASAGEEVESNDAVNYWNKHGGKGFLDKLNEIGKLGTALERHHGVSVPPEGLLKLMAQSVNRKAA